MNAHNPTDVRQVRIFRNGRSQAVRIPREWEFSGDEVELRRLPDGRILLNTAQTAGLVEYLRTAEPWTGGDFVPDEAEAALDEIDLQ